MSFEADRYYRDTCRGILRIVLNYAKTASIKMMVLKYLCTTFFTDFPGWVGLSEANPLWSPRRKRRRGTMFSLIRRARKKEWDSEREKYKMLNGSKCQKFLFGRCFTINKRLRKQMFVDVIVFSIFVFIGLRFKKKSTFDGIFFSGFLSEPRRCLLGGEWGKSVLFGFQFMSLSSWD